MIKRFELNCLPLYFKCTHQQQRHDEQDTLDRHILSGCQRNLSRGTGSSYPASPGGNGKATESRCLMTRCGTWWVCLETESILNLSVQAVITTKSRQLNGLAELTLPPDNIHREPKFSHFVCPHCSVFIRIRSPHPVFVVLVLSDAKFIVTLLGGWSHGLYISFWRGVVQPIGCTDESNSKVGYVDFLIWLRGETDKEEQVQELGIPIRTAGCHRLVLIWIHWLWWLGLW